MTVAKQPAVYTHTCDRCGGKVASDDGDASVHGWVRIDSRARPTTGSVQDLCAGCAPAFVAFMKGEPLQGVSR